MTERDRLIELLIDSNYYTYEDQADYLLANGVIVPPCKVGDVVWVNWENYGTGKKEIHSAKVYALRFDTKKNNMRICVEGVFEVTAYRGKFNHYYNATFAWNSVGKTVFLTREEAEAALAERGKG